MSRDLKIFLTVLILILVTAAMAGVVFFLLNGRADRQMATAAEKYNFGEKNDIKRGIEIYASVINNQRNSPQTVQEAMFYSAQGYILLWQKTKDLSKLEIAKKKFQELITTYPESQIVQRALLEIARINFLRGDYDVALAELNNIYNRFPDAETKTAIYNQKGDIYYAIGDYNQAVYAYSRPENHNSEYAMLGRAKAYLAMGRTPKALDIYEDFLKFHAYSEYTKTVQKTYLDKAYNYAFHLYNAKKRSEAIHFFGKIIELFPGSTKAENAHYWIGECYYDDRNYAKAIDAFQDVLDNRSTEHKDPDALLKLGYCYFEMGDFNKALSYFVSLIDNFPSHRLYTKAVDWKEQTIREIRYQ